MQEPVTLPGRAVPLHLYDTAARQVRRCDPGPTARMYVCGITPYDATHLGHAATYLAFDLVNRIWRDLGHAVEYVQNVTDVDDPLLERASQTGQDWRTLAAAEIDLFASDMAALNILPPTQLVGVVESMARVGRWVGLLRGEGRVYPVDDDLYFDVTGAPGFGTVAGLDSASMRSLFAERGGDPQRSGKHHELDCLVWQGARPGEPSWDLPIGRGRPGWHIGCTAIALDHLGAGFDLQGGGSDLAFPHHEMCAALGRAATGAPEFARHYVHAGMVGLGGEKMSKSLGNLVLVSRLREAGVHPGELRLALLDHRYRSDRDWTTDGLGRAQHRASLWRAALSAPAAAPGEPLLAVVRARLSDDLDASGALRAVDDWARATLDGEQPDPAAPALAADLLDTLLGVNLS